MGFASSILGYVGRFEYFVKDFIMESFATKITITGIKYIASKDYD